MQETEIILDDKSFKALSADSRVNILKSLGQRRMTLTELSKKLSLENSTIKEHCSVLIDANLIKLIDDGHKWKYYELTGKGKSIIIPSLMEQVRVLIMLCFGAVLFGGILFIALSSTSMIGSTQNNQDTLLKSTYENEPMLTTAARDVVMEETSYVEPTQEITREFFVGVVSLSLIAGMIIGWISAKKAI